MKRLGLSILAALVALGTVFLMPRLVGAYERTWLNQNVWCHCGMGGCQHVLSQCGTECPLGAVRRQQIAQMVESGIGMEAIRQSIVAEYGPDAIRQRRPWLPDPGVAPAVALLGVCGAAAIAAAKRRRSRPLVRAS